MTQQTKKPESHKESSVGIIPSDWYNETFYFFTYYGDVYHGYLIDSPNEKGSFYIISNNKINEYKSLTKTTDENLNKIGWKIENINVIEHVEKELDLKDNYPESIKSNGGYKKMFVFGAGASAYCTFNDNDKLKNDSLRPPIGTEIFDERFEEICNKYPGVQLSIPKYEAAERDIEAMLENEWQAIIKTKNTPVLKRHIDIQYYLQEMLDKVSSNITQKHYRKNLYSLLFEKLQRHYTQHIDEKFSVVSFNYDTILDYFLSKSFDVKFDTMDDYISTDNHPFLFIKPHGSSNWGWTITENWSEKIGHQGVFHSHLQEKGTSLYKLYFDFLGDAQTNIFRYSWGLESQIHINRLGRYTINKDRIQTIGNFDIFYPALLLPYRDKDEFIMPYTHHNALLYLAMPSVEELFLIGWKGNEDLFNRMMQGHASNLKRIIIVNPENEVVKQNLLKYARYNDKQIEIKVIDTFENFVINHLENYLNDTK